MTRTLIVFDLAGSHYGINIAVVKTVIKRQPVSLLPFMPPYMEGLTNLRGEILPVINLCKRLDLSVSAVNKDNRLMVIQSQAELVGFTVDSVSGVLNVEEEDIAPLLEMNATLDSKYLQGFVKKDRDLILLLETDELLRIERRLNRRRQLDCGLTFTPEGKSTQYAGECMDISAGGLQMRAKENLAIGQHLSMQINFSHRQNAYCLTGMVKWKSVIPIKGRQGSQFDYGIQFDNIPLEFRRELL
jgi:purine-binding chemotaxis protein CheW